MDTIFAMSTAPGKAGVSIIRVSGPEAFIACERLFCSDVPPYRSATLRELAYNGLVLDQAIVLSFEEGKSFTGEKIVEFHIHGSQAVVSAVLAALSEITGFRPADPGEFTRRALENGRLDIAQVEGLADLIDSETEAQRIQALRVFSGALGDKADIWRSSLIRAAALLEATIDFVDEDVPIDVTDEVRSLLGLVLGELQDEIAGAVVAERIRAGYEVAIVGAPNVGKSTLLNALAGRDAAITSEIAGTTRDVIEVRMNLNGLPVTFLDTAGIRETDDPLEAIGVERARKRASEADLRVFLVGMGDRPQFLTGADDIVLQAKVDLQPSPEPGISGKTGEGIANLVNQITGLLQQRSADVGVATRLRHKLAMEQALEPLQKAVQHCSEGGFLLELAAEEIRTTIRTMDSLVGRVDVENVLDEIFSSFCIGK